MVSLLTATLLIRVGGATGFSRDNAGGISASAQQGFQPLTPKDVALYKKIFALGEQGRWTELDRKLKQVKNPVLRGHVMAQRYLHPVAWRSRYRELKNWMARYADHPQARRIYNLALKRRPKNHTLPKKPAPLNAQRYNAHGKTWVYKPRRKLSKANNRKAHRLSRQIRWNIYNQRLTITEEILGKKGTKKLLDPIEINQHKMALAAAWYYLGRNEKALRLARAAAFSEKYLPMSHWTAGLAAWRMARFSEAGAHFEKMVQAERLGGWNKAAGAYWAARAALKLEQPEKISPLLHQAARYPRTFYGLLARKALGLDTRFAPDTPQINSASLQHYPGFERIAALRQIGRIADAQKETLLLARRIKAEDIPRLTVLSEQAGFAQATFRMGAQLAAQTGDSRDPANSYGFVDKSLFPLPHWVPQDGYRLDRALIYAFMRQESGFNPRAKSPAGARGLLQLMPGTARYMSRGTPYNGRDRAALFRPDLNLLLGQKYLAYLLDHAAVKGNLVKLMVAYNGGPGNLLKWVRETDFNDDPLLFIESIPSRETRIFIERVLTNLWIYRARLRQNPPSLEALARGQWPVYRGVDHTETKVAHNVKN